MEIKWESDVVKDFLNRLLLHSDYLTAKNRFIFPTNMF